MQARIAARIAAEGDLAAAARAVSGDLLDETQHGRMGRIGEAGDRGGVAALPR